MVVCEADVKTQALSVALRQIRSEISQEAMVRAVPAPELEEILWTALLAVPDGFEECDLERWLLNHVRQALAAWQASKERFGRQGGELTGAQENGRRLRASKKKRRR